MIQEGFQMKYVYPNFPKPILNGMIRVAGPGLGNLLFDFAGAIVIAEEIDSSYVIWPTWWSVKIGTFIRKERDKRLYLNIFKNTGNYISGIRKIWLLSTNRKKVFTQ